MEPEQRFYKASQQPTSEVAIRRRLNEDLYLNFAGRFERQSARGGSGLRFPAGLWIWIGLWVLAIGTMVCLIPSKVRLHTPAHKWLEWHKKHVQVTK